MLYIVGLRGRYISTIWSYKSQFQESHVEQGIDLQQEGQCGLPGFFVLQDGQKPGPDRHLVCWGKYLELGRAAWIPRTPKKRIQNLSSNTHDLNTWIDSNFETSWRLVHHAVYPELTVIEAPRHTSVFKLALKESMISWPVPTWLHGGWMIQEWSM
jgi:hypothetical protein